MNILIDPVYRTKQIIFLFLYLFFAYLVLELFLIKEMKDFIFLDFDVIEFQDSLKYFLLPLYFYLLLSFFVFFFLKIFTKDLRNLIKNMLVGIVILIIYILLNILIITIPIRFQFKFFLFFVTIFALGISFSFISPHSKLGKFFEKIEVIPETLTNMLVVCFVFGGIGFWYLNLQTAGLGFSFGIFFYHAFFSMKRGKNEK